MQSTRSALMIFFSDLPLSPTLGGQRAVGQHHAHTATRSQVPDHVLEPGKVGVARRGRAVLPAHIVQQLVLPPAGQVKGRICQDEVRLQLGVGVVKEGVGAELAQVGLKCHGWQGSSGPSSRWWGWSPDQKRKFY